MAQKVARQQCQSHLKQICVLAIVGLRQLLAQEFIDQCPASSFIASCQLDAETQQGTFLSPSEPWVRCVPKTCPDFPYQERGQVTGLPARVGDMINITCDPGWKVTGGSATPICQPDCTFSSLPSCTRIQCPSVILENGEQLPRINSGESVRIDCPAGFRAEFSIPSLLTPCLTWIEARCTLEGEWEVPERCVPVQCIPFPADHDSLSCKNELTCGEALGITVAAVAPDTATAHNQHVEIACNAGFVLIDEDGNVLQHDSVRCTDNCLYSNLASSCQPQECNNFAPPNTETSVTPLVSGRQLQVSCAEGHSFKGSVEWGSQTCARDSESKTSECRGRGDLTLVLSRSILAVIDPTTLHILDTFSNFQDQTLLDMVFRVQNLTRHIVGAVDGVLVLDEPLPRWVQAGSAYTVYSEWRPPVTNLVCEPLHCEAFERPIGQYVPLDDDVLPTGKRPRFGEAITVTCKPGFFVVDDLGVNISRNTMPNATTYQATCRRCRYAASRHCAVAECFPHALDNATEEAARPGVVLYGDSVEVQCRYGYRAAPAAAGPGGLVPVESSLTARSYSRLCGEGRMLGDSGRCVPASCGVFEDEHATFEERPEMLHTDPALRVTCHPGYRAEATPSRYDQPCMDDFWVVCDDGAFQYRDLAPSNAFARPRCVRHCGLSEQRCGTEACPAGAGQDPNAELVPPGAPRVSHGSIQIVQCKTGHRANDAEAGFASCDNATTYRRTCGYCDFVPPPQVCQRVRCIWEATLDLYGVPSTTSSLYEDQVAVFCNVGYRAYHTPLPSALQPRQYVRACADGCELIPVLPNPFSGLRCREVSCGEYAVPANANTFDSNLLLTNTRSPLYVRCADGFKRKGSTSTFDAPCQNDWYVRCDDGVLEYSFDGASGNFTSSLPEAPTCERHCGLPAEPCGYESCNASLNLDPHAKPPVFGRYPSTYIQPIECMDGYRAQGAGHNASACDDPVSYERTCGYCEFVPAEEECVPVLCRWDPALERNGLARRTEAVFGEAIAVTCNTGFRPSTGGVNPTKEVPREYDMRCTNECDLAPTTAGTACTPVSCGDGILVSNADMFGNTDVEVIHGSNPRWVRCNAGYRLEASETTVDTSCVNEFMVRCNDGVLEFSLDGERFANNPQPNCVRHCGQPEDECGAESCNATRLRDPNAAPPSRPFVPSGQQEVVECQAGYRAQARGADAGVTCDLSQQFQRQCGYCSFYEPDTECKRVQCTFTRNVDLFGVAVANTTVTLEDPFTVRCNAGFRASATVQPLGNAPRTYDRYCAEDCQLRTDAAQTICRPLSCGVPPLVRNTEPYDTANSLVFGEATLHVSCILGYRVQDSVSTVDNPCIDSFHLRCADGTFEHSLDGVNFVLGVPTCVRHCGLATESCGQSSCPASADYDGNAQPVADPSSRVDAGALQEVVCNEGFRTTTGDVAFATCAGNESYVRRCGHCEFLSPGVHCERIVCERGPDVDFNGVVEGSDNIWLGTVVVITCNFGYRASSTPAPGPDVDDRYTRTCVDEQDFPCTLLDTSNSNTLCRPVSCGAFNLVEHASYPQVVQLLHTDDPVQISCETGYRLASQSSSFNKPCNSTFFVRCVDGQYEYSLDGAVYSPYDPGSPSAPECIRHCGQENETCGTESCSAYLDLDPHATDPQSAVVASHETQTIRCRNGYRVTVAGSSHASCAESTSYARECRYCSFADTNRQCLPIQCIWSSSIDFFATSSETSILFGESLEVSCNVGYRASRSPLPLSGEPRQYSMSCQDDQDGTECSLDSDGLQCTEVRCDDLSFPNSRGDGTFGVLQHSSDPTQVICNTGYMASSSSSSYDTPCQDYFFVRCRDGTLQYSLARTSMYSNEEISCERHCGLTTDACGSESCASNQALDSNAIVPPQGMISSSELQDITCNAGFRAQSLESPMSDCSDSASYQRQCGYCDFVPADLACVRVRCLFRADDDPHATAAADGTLYESELTAHCNVGYRASSVDSNPAPTEPSEYQMDCLEDCSLTPVVAGMACRAVACARVEVADGAVVAGDEVPVHGAEATQVQCNTGYMASTSTSTYDTPCTASFLIRCADGVYEYSVDGGSVYSSDVVGCVRHCGRETEACGAESCLSSNSLDPHAATPSEDRVDNSMVQTVTCQPGYRARPSAVSVASCTDATQYDRTCGFCQFEAVDSYCAPVECSWDASLDMHGDVSQSSTVFGQSLTVTCRLGYRASSADDPSRVQPQSYAMACADDVPTQECPLQAEEEGTQCREVSCGVFSIADGQPASGISEILRHGSDPIEIQCNAGYRLDTSGSSFSSPCVDSFLVRCQDGNFEFSYNGISYSSTTWPTCVRHCGKESEACGSESCLSTNALDSNAATPTAEYVGSQELQTVTCNSGYRAKALDSLNAFCSDPETFQRRCGYCEFQDAAQRCVKVRCSWTQTQDPNGVSFVPGVLFGETIQITCNIGYRASAGATSTVSDVNSYLVACENDCSLAPSPATVRCREVSCGSLSLEHSSVSGPAGTGELFHDSSTVLVICDAGYRLATAASSYDTACRDRFLMRCNDGTLQFSIDGGAYFSSPTPSCVRHCGNASELCGAESCLPTTQLDTNAQTPSEIRIQPGDQQTVTCNLGYRARSVDENSAACSHGSQFQRICGFCDFAPQSLWCAPVRCFWDAAFDPNGVSSDESAFFGEAVTVSCNVGYRAGASGGPLRTAPASYQRTCSDNREQSTCSFATDEAGTRCRAVTCGIFSVGQHSSSASNGVEITHASSPVLVQCDTGHQVDVAASSYESACSDTYFVRCQDGVFEYSVDGATYDSRTLGCVKHCGLATESCGSESCNVTSTMDENGSPTAFGRLSPGERQTIQCNEGYRAQDLASLSAACTDDSSYQTTCGFCYFQAAAACKPVRCTWDAGIDPNGVTNLDDVLFEDQVTVTCNVGYRGSELADPGPEVAQEYYRYCAADCNLQTYAAGTKCREVMCGNPDTSFANADIQGQPRGLRHLSEPLTVKCRPGFRLDGYPSTYEEPCSNTFFVRCYDGEYQFSVDGSAFGPSRPSCVRHCGAPQEECGSESCAATADLDVNAETPTQTWINATSVQTVRCKSGYRVRSRGASHSTCSDPEEYERWCGYCEFRPAEYQCLDVRCEWSNATDPNGRAKDIDNVEFDEELTVACNVGYRAFSIPNPAYLVGREYKARCVSTCSLEPTIPDRRCREVACGAFTFPNTRHEESPEVFMVHSSSPLRVTCLPGYRLETSSSSFAQSCEDTFFVRCADGQFEYSFDGVQYSPSTVPVCVRHCGLPSEVCGTESCAATGGLDPYAVSPIAERVNSTQRQSVVCQDGYRVRPVGAAFSTCNDSSVFERQCGYCEFEQPSVRCINVRCLWDSAAERNGRPASGNSILFGEQMIVQCNAGYRAGLSDPVPMTNPDNYVLTCRPFDCTLSSVIGCRLVGCDTPFRISNGTAIGSASGMTVGSTIAYQCYPGFALANRKCNETSGVAVLGPDCKWHYDACVAYVPGCSLFDPNSLQSNSIFQGSKSFVCKDSFAVAEISDDSPLYCTAGMPQTYSASCSTDCQLSVSAHCRILSCPQVDWAQVDPNAAVWNAPNASESVQIGDSVLLLCRKGYRGGNTLVDHCGSTDGVDWCMDDAPRLSEHTCSSRGGTVCGFRYGSPCRVVTCGVFPGVQNATITTALKERFYYGESVAYTCDEGYRIADAGSDDLGCVHSWVADCQDDGSWTVKPCVPIFCPTPHALNGSVVSALETQYRDAPIPYNVEVSIGCTGGFELAGLGDTRAVCQQNCMLSPHDFCVPIICRLGTPPNNSVVLDMHGVPCASKCQAVFPNFITVQCRPGFIIATGGAVAFDPPQSSLQLQCQASRAFENLGVACVEARCPSLFEQFDGKDFGSPMRVDFDTEAESSFRSVAHGMEVLVKCNTGFVLNTTEFKAYEMPIRCGGDGINGAWEEVKLACVAEVPPPGSPSCGAFLPCNNTEPLSSALNAELGRCTRPDRISITRRQGSCSKAWLAECTWMGFTGIPGQGWEWAYKAVRGPLEYLHRHERGACPCDDLVRCVVPASGNGALFEVEGERVVEARAVERGTVVRSYCEQGHFQVREGGEEAGGAAEQEPSASESEGSVLSQCSLSCQLSPAPATCERHECLDILQVFDFSTAETSRIDWENRFYGDQVEVSCPEGFMLDTSPSQDGGVVASEQFVPPGSEPATFRLNSDPRITLHFPAGAWPSSEKSPLRVSVLRLDPGSALLQSAQAPEQKLVGAVVRFEPSGLQFSKPVTLTLPMERNVDLGALVPAVHVFNPRNLSWERKPYPEDASAPVNTSGGTVQASTTSFSNYAVLAVPPFESPRRTPAPRTPATPPPPTDVPDEANDDLAAALTIAAVVLGDLAIVLATLCVCVSRRKRKAMAAGDAWEEDPKKLRGELSFVVKDRR